MGQGYLIDTNVISHLFADRLPKKGLEFVVSVVNDNFLVSVAVEIEVLTFHATPDKMPMIEEFMGLATILPLDKNVTKKAIDLRRNSRKMKLGDAIIAATALIHKLILVTNNIKDFRHIPELELVDPHQL